VALPTVNQKTQYAESKKLHLIQRQSARLHLHCNAPDCAKAALFRARFPGSARTVPPPAKFDRREAVWESDWSRSVSEFSRIGILRGALPHQMSSKSRWMYLNTTKSSRPSLSRSTRAALVDQPARNCTSHSVTSGIGSGSLAPGSRRDISRRRRKVWRQSCPAA